MGGVFASALAEFGDPVTLLDTNRDVAEAIRRNGLRVIDSRGERSVQVPIVSDVAEVSDAEVVFFFVKAQHTRAAAESVRSVVTDDAIVVSLQNGWGNADVLGDVFSSEQIVLGVTYSSATVKEPGVVVHNGSGDTIVGPYLDDAGTDLANTVAQPLRDAGIPLTVVDKVKDHVWKKLTLNAATLPVAALTRLSAGAMSSGSPVNQVVRGLAAEAVAVGRAMGFDIDLDERLDAIEQVLSRAGPGKPSMLQDVEAGRKTEIEVICAAVVAEAERLAIDVPLNDAMVALVHGLETSYLP